MKIRFREEAVDVSWIKDIPPFYSDPNHPAIQLAAGAAAEVRGVPVGVRPMPAWTDICYIASRLNIPTLCMGAATPGEAHSAHEYVKIAALVADAKAVTLTLRRCFERRRQGE